MVGKILHHWISLVIYKTLSNVEIKISIECAEALNSFNEDIMTAKIEDLVNETICSELPKCCEYCQLNI